MIVVTAKSKYCWVSSRFFIGLVLNFPIISLLHSQWRQLSNVSILDWSSPLALSMKSIFNSLIAMKQRQLNNADMLHQCCLNISNPCNFSVSVSTEPLAHYLNSIAIIITLISVIVIALTFLTAIIITNHINNGCTFFILSAIDLLILSLCLGVSILCKKQDFQKSTSGSLFAEENYIDSCSSFFVVTRKH